MPELPEVETIKRILETIVNGKTIEKIEVYREKNIISGAKEFVDSLTGETFLRMSRKGKYLIFHLTNDKVVVSHLAMEGKYYACKANHKQEKHDIFLYSFTDGEGLRYEDTRKFGRLFLRNESDYLSLPPLDKVGPEPWDIEPKDFHKKIKDKKLPIKEVLLDQTIMSGLGNIYDDEVLYASKIHPLTPACKINLPKCKEIIEHSRRILEMAVRNGGSTIKSYHPSEGVSGMMQNDLLAYGTENKPCHRCSFPMRKIFIGGRSSTFCPHCQKKDDRPLIVGVTGPIACGKSTVSSILEENGYSKIDADKIVEKLYEKKPAKDLAKAIFGDLAVKSGAVDKQLILNRMNEDSQLKKAFLKRFNELIYSKLQKEIDSSASKKIVLDIPLLIGTPFEEQCDLIIYCHADEKIQRSRLIERGKDPDKYLALNKGFPKGRAKQKSGLVIETGISVKELKSVLLNEKYLFKD